MRGDVGVGWVDLKSPWGAQLLVRGAGIEVSLAPPIGRFMSAERFFNACETTMRLDRIGWSGTPIGKRDCIRLEGIDATGKVELAVSPVGASIQDAWNALLSAGATAHHG
jgi:hypothetical protein